MTRSERRWTGYRPGYYRGKDKRYKVETEAHYLAIQQKKAITAYICQRILYQKAELTPRASAESR